MCEKDAKMSRDFVKKCVGCLSTNRRLVEISSLQNIGEILKQVPLNEKDLVCWECKAMFNKTSRFIRKVINVQIILKNKEFLHLQDQSYSNLATTLITKYDVDYKHDLKTEIASNINLNLKQEIENDFKEECCDIEVLDMYENDIKPIINIDCTINSNSAIRKNSAKPATSEKTDVKVTTRGKKHVRLTTKENNIDKNSLKHFSTRTISEEELSEARMKERSETSYFTKIYKCESCIIGYYKEDKLKKHISERHFESKITCKICQMSFDSIYNLKCHERDHYTCYSCNSCDFESHRLSRIKYHCIKTHSGGFICETCQKPFSSFGRLRYHRNTKHSYPATCKICDMTLASQCGLTKHMLLHTDMSPSTYICDICMKNFKSKSGIRSHIIFNHLPKCSDENAYCAECDIQFVNVERYKRHLKTNSKHIEENINFNCDRCDRVFKKKNNLKRHVQIFHLKDKKHICQICEKRFVSNFRLSEHMSYSHEGKVRPRKFICTYCQKGFTNRVLLSIHTRIHTGEKPFQCHLCSTKFTQNSALQTHIKGVHLKILRKVKINK